MTTAFISAFVLVLGRAFQQKNVMHDLYIPAFFTSFIMAGADVGIILSGVEHGWEIVPAIGFGGAFGVVTAMYTHNRIFKKNKIH